MALKRRTENYPLWVETVDFHVDEKPYVGKVFPTLMGWTPSWISSCHHLNSGGFLYICGYTSQKANDTLATLCFEDTLFF